MSELVDRKHTSACLGCGSPDPARIDGMTCSDCADFDRCPMCRRWIGEGFAAPVTVIWEDRIASICEPCFMRQSPSVPLDYREAS